MEPIRTFKGHKAIEDDGGKLLTNFYDKGHCGGSSTINNDIEQTVTVAELDKVKNVMNDYTAYIIIAKPTDIPVKFKEWRLYRNLTLREVEAATGISNPYLSMIETGKIKRPSFEVVSKLCDIYKIRLIVGW